MRSIRLHFTGLLCILSAASVTAGEVEIKYDEQQNIVATIAFGDRYDIGITQPSDPYNYPDAAFIMYHEGWADEGYSNPYDDSIMVGAYDNGDPATSGSPGYMHCMIPRSSKLFEKALYYLVSGNGGSKVQITAQDPSMASNGIPECLSFRPGGTSTTIAEINLAWAPFWLYNMQAPTGAPYQTFYGSLVPFPLSNGELVRRVEIQELATGEMLGRVGGSVKLTAVDTSVVGDGPVFGPSFKCVKNNESARSDIYTAMSSSPSRHITFGVENDAYTGDCKHLYIELSTWLFQM